MRIEIVDAATTRPLRLAVLRPGYPADTPTLPEHPDAGGLAARDGETVAGAAVLLPRRFAVRPDDPAWQLAGMAVAPDRQGQGVGMLLLDRVVALAGERGAALVWCNARATATGFYRRHGWRTEGEQFVGAIGLPHVVMWRPVEPPGPATSSHG